MYVCMYDMQVAKLFREKERTVKEELEKKRLGLWREHVQNSVNTVQANLMST